MGCLCLLRLSLLVASIDPSYLLLAWEPISLDSTGALSSSKRPRVARGAGQASEISSEAMQIWNKSPGTLDLFPSGTSRPSLVSLILFSPSDYSLTFYTDKLLLLLTSLRNKPMPQGRERKRERFSLIQDPTGHRSWHFLEASDQSWPCSLL